MHYVLITFENNCRCVFENYVRYMLRCCYQPSGSTAEKLENV